MCAPHAQVLQAPVLADLLRCGGWFSPVVLEGEAVSRLPGFWLFGSTESSRSADVDFDETSITVIVVSTRGCLGASGVAEDWQKGSRALLWEDENGHLDPSPQPWGRLPKRSRQVSQVPAGANTPQPHWERSFILWSTP